MFVLQDWVSKVGCKQQSILLSGFRAPDQHTIAVKKCVRWLRAQCQIDADPGKQSYMKSITMCNDLIDAAMDELEYCPVHYCHHLADSFAVLAYHHPNQAVRMWALKLHREVAVELFHFHPESREEFLERHKDKFRPVPMKTLCSNCGGLAPCLEHAKVRAMLCEGCTTLYD